MLTSVKTLCECRLEHTKVQFRQWLRCFSRPCWSWKSYSENPCRHTKRSTLPHKLFIPELFDLKFQAWHCTWKHLKQTLNWGDFLKALWGSVPSNFSRKQSVYNIELQSSYNYINEYPHTSKAGLHGASINPMTQVFQPIHNIFTTATLKIHMCYTLKTMGELSTFPLLCKHTTAQNCKGNKFKWHFGRKLLIFFFSIHKQHTWHRAEFLGCRSPSGATAHRTAKAFGISWMNYMI